MIENPIISIDAECKYNDRWEVVMKVLLPPDPENRNNVKEIRLIDEDYSHKKEVIQHKVELLRKAFGIEIRMVKSSLPPKILINEFPQEII